MDAKHIFYTAAIAAGVFAIGTLIVTRVATVAALNPRTAAGAAG